MVKTALGLNGGRGSRRRFTSAAKLGGKPLTNQKEVLRRPSGIDLHIRLLAVRWGLATGCPSLQRCLALRRLAGSTENHWHEATYDVIMRRRHRHSLPVRLHRARVCFPTETGNEREMLLSPAS